MRTALLILLTLGAPALAGQTVWKWVDEKGVTHYSDRPVPGATQVELGGGSRWDSSTAVAPPPAAPAPAAQPGNVSYQVEITSPANDETIVNAGGQVSVNIAVEPPLEEGHQLSLYLDGRLVESETSGASSYALRDVPRGTHWLIATINDADGNRLQETNRVTFTVRQESAAQPPVGPALRPPPKRPRAAGNKLRSSQPSYADLNGSRPRIDPATNAPVVTKPAPKTPKPGN